MIPASLRAERMCGGKKPYLDATTARIVGNKCEAKKQGLVLRVYKCPHCGFWHLTKRKGR